MGCVVAHINKGRGCLQASVSRIGGSLVASTERLNDGIVVSADRQGEGLNVRVGIICSASAPNLLVIIPNEVNFTYDGGVAVVNVKCSSNWDVL